MTPSFSALNEPQREAVETLNGPLLVLAGAGSGKTRVVTARIVNLIEHDISPSSILGLTFTNKAAGEMKERVAEMLNCHVLVCTFHSLGARILRESATYVGLTRGFTIYDEQDVEKLMKMCLEELGDTELDAKRYLQLISKAKNAMQGPEDLYDECDDAVKVYRAYQNKLKSCNAVDFDDLLYLPATLFMTNLQVLEYYQNRWSHLLIDEFQDTNNAQYMIVKNLAAQHRNICVVGDPDQSIYSWRGADVGNILGFEKDYPDAKVISLEQNYRSKTNILNGANALIKINPRRYEKALWSDLGPGEKIKLYTADTERMEAEFVSTRIRYHHEQGGIPLKNMAVFYRTNAQSRVLEDRLLMHYLPYVIVGGISFYQRREIKDILAFLRLAQSGMDYVAFQRTINIPKRGIGEATIEKLRMAAALELLPILDYCESLLAKKSLQNVVKLSKKQEEAISSFVGIIKTLKEMKGVSSIREMVSAVIENSGYMGHLDLELETKQERKENLNALMAKAYEWEISSTEPTLEGFLEELSLKSSLDEADGSKEKVSLMTVHNSKGLEFDVVFLVGMEEDLFPHANSRDDEYAQEEELRLCYVGMTRAKELLYLCDVRQRFLWGVTRQQRPSRFLRSIPSEYVQRERPSYLYR